MTDDRSFRSPPVPDLPRGEAGRSPAHGAATSDALTTLVQRAIPVVVLTSLPWIMLAVNADWIYSSAQSIDSWVYHGYFHRFPEFVSIFFPQAYYGTRLAWILPGFAAYHLLESHAANLTLHLIFYYVALAAVYRATALLTTRAAALICASAFGTAIPTIVAFGWDYVDGAVITYTVVAIWAVIEAGGRRRRAPLLAVAGAAAACIVHSNLAAVMLGPTIIAAYWNTHARKRWSDLGFFVGGGVLATAVLGACSVVAGGPFLFFMPSVRWATANVHTQTFDPTPPLKWPGSARFIIPLVGVSTAVGAFASRRTPATWTALSMLLCLAVAFLAYDWTLSAALLQTQYYVSWFLPLAFFGVAAAIGPAAIPLTTAIMLSAVIVVIQVSALGHVPHALRQAVFDRIGTASPAAEIALAGATLVIIAAVSSRARRKTHAVVVALAITVANTVVTPNLTYGPSADGRSQFDAVELTLTFIRTHVPRESQPLFWIASNTSNASYFISLASTHLYLYSLISSVYPRLRDDTGNAPPGSDVGPGDYVVVAADAQADPAVVDHEFQQIDLRATVMASVPVRTEHANFVLTLLRISD